MHRLIIATGLVAGALASGAAAADRPAAYRLVWREAASPVAHVEADLRSTTCSFRTGEQWASFFPDKRGWSRFITGLQARDGRGGSLPVVAGDDGVWRVGAGKPCSVRVTYSVDFSFGRQTWEAGNEQVAYADGRAVYTTGLPLFVLGDDGPSTVRIEAPDGWSISTPWRVQGATYLVANHDALLSNTLVVGRYSANTFQAGGFTVTAALLGEMAAAGPRLSAAFDKIVPRYAALFGFEETDRYMFVVMPGSEDGEAFNNSFAVTTRHVPNDANRIVWANHLAHELLHYWMGGKLAPSAEDSPGLQWFTEGFTEYLADQVLAQERILTDQQYLDRLSRHVGYYLLARENPNYLEVSLRAAGERKWRNRPLVYSGGAVFGLCLDQEIRAASKGGRSLADALRALYARSRTGVPLTQAAIVTASSEAAGQDLGPYFAKYVDGVERLPVRDCLARAGIDADIQGYNAFLKRP